MQNNNPQGRQKITRIKETRASSVSNSDSNLPAGSKGLNVKGWVACCIKDEE